jgi:ubiquinone/menaquinone biosynthesis C-methylase UbiE
MPAISDEIQDDKLQTEYSALAPVYDRRWRAYLEKSLSLTLGKAAGLPAERLLDVGCGTGTLLEMFAAFGQSSELVGVDKVPAMLLVARQRLGQRAKVVHSDAASLPFADSHFQLVISTNALHYFADAEAALREMRRVLEPQGNLVITDWCRDFLWMKLLNRMLPRTRHAHAHTLSVDELEKLLTRTNFRIKSVTKMKIGWFWGLMSVHAAPV